MKTQSILKIISSYIYYISRFFLISQINPYNFLSEPSCDLCVNGECLKLGETAYCNCYPGWTGTACDQSNQVIYTPAPTANHVSYLYGWAWDGTFPTTGISVPGHVPEYLSISGYKILYMLFLIKSLNLFIIFAKSISQGWLYSWLQKWRKMCRYGHVDVVSMPSRIWWRIMRTWSGTESFEHF